MTVSTPAQWIDRGQAKAVVAEFLGRGYGNWFWDDMVGRPDRGSLGCVLQHIQTNLPVSRWTEAGFYVGRELRRRYRNDKRAWDAMSWDTEFDTVLETILDGIRACERTAPPALATVEPAEWNPTADVQPNGFVPWRLFRHRHPMPNQHGIYVFAYFEGLPEQEANPLSKSVIYIGYSGHQQNRRTIAQRLDEFEQTALGELGHSAGWTYRTEFVSDWECLMLFRNTYVTWKAYGRETADHPRDAEKQLIAQFRTMWGERPFLNRKD